MEISVKLFGKAKELNSAGIVKVVTDRPLKVCELRQALTDLLSQSQDREAVQGLIEDCAVGNQQQILGDQDFVGDSQSLVLLPPVCGG